MSEAVTLHKWVTRSSMGPGTSKTGCPFRCGAAVTVAVNCVACCVLIVALSFCSKQSSVHLDKELNPQEGC
jgi:hypothetical protein